MIIRVKNTGHQIEAEGGNLLDILFDQEIFIDNPCNGRGTCGKCKVRIESVGAIPVSDADRKLIKDEELDQGIRLACTFDVTEAISITTLQDEKEIEVLTKGFVPEFEIDGKEGYGIAVDIGTTTIALALVDRKNGEEIAAASMVNPQKKFGLDVLTRITYEIEEGEKGIREIQKTTVKGINALIDRVLKGVHIKRDEVETIVVAANCTMTHTLLGANTASMGKFPFEPAFRDAQELPAKEIGLNLPMATLHCSPQVSAFIGGDIVAGAYVAGLHKEERNVLFIDIGTNGELVLASGGKMISCSCAAGPALEGMNISHGMRAAEGAIEDVKISEEGIELEVIGDKVPIGLCGSGILAVTKEVLRTGLVKKSGVFVKPDQLSKDDYRRNLLRMDGKKRILVLAEDPEVLVTQGDLRQVQLAKGAILSGVITLLKIAGLKAEDLDEVLIAGQFGSHLSPESIAGTGIIPDGLEDRIRYMGNSSITGAYMALLSDKSMREMDEVAKEMEYLELATTEDYEAVFRDACIFPDYGH